MKKGDWLCIGLFLLICIAGFLLFLPRSSAAKAVVAVDGEPILTLSLEEDGIYETEHHVLEVRDGAIRVLKSDCSGQDCVRTGFISRRGQTIVCLPYHLSVSLDAPGEYDAVTGHTGGMPNE